MVSRIFDAVLYAVRVVASFYKVQYKHIITMTCGVHCAVYMCICFKFSGAYDCVYQELAKLDDVSNN